MQVWQVAAGDGSRDYTTVFTRFGVLLTGPGTDGPYNANTQPYKPWPFIHETAAGLKDQDLVALKRPSGKSWEVVAVGRILGEYEWIENFEDVEGWDLQHARRVEWRLPAAPTFVPTLRRGTLSRVNNGAASAAVCAAWEGGNPVVAQALAALPPPLTDDELIETLVDDGLRVSAAEDVAQTLRRVRRLASWYQRKGRDVSEHETRSFIVVPLLLALGWPEQQLKVEWNRLDIALFDRHFGAKDAQLHAIVETKRLREGLGGAEKQVMNYATSHPTCRHVVVTDGISYKVFSRASGTWAHTASMNLLLPRQTHWFLPGVGGAVGVFRALLPP